MHAQCLSVLTPRPQPWWENRNASQLSAVEVFCQDIETSWPWAAVLHVGVQRDSTL